MISWLKEKGQKIRAWAGEHPFLAATTIVAATLATGGVVYLAYRQFNGNEEIVFMDTLLDVVDPVSLTEPEFAVESPLIDMPETDEDFAYWLSYRREHLRDITPKCPSV